MFATGGSGEAKVTTAQLALTIIIVGEVCFIAGFLTGTRRTMRRFRDYLRRRDAHRAIHAAHFRPSEAPRAANDRESRLPPISVPDGVYSLHGTEHEEGLRLGR